MSTRTVLISLLVFTLGGAVPTSGAQSTARRQAQEHYSTGLDHMRNEAFDAAVKAFRSATEVDPTFEMAYYMLGRVQLVQRSFVAATQSLSRAAELFRTQASTTGVNKQEAQRSRRERIAELNDLITALQAQPQTYAVREQIRQYQERIRQVEDADRSSDLSPEKAVPAFVSLSLGSAYFRSGKLAQAETAYRATIAADPKVAEAHVNLAVVYMESGRLEDAERSVAAAEALGFRVQPALKEEIRKRKGGKP